MTSPQPRRTRRRRPPSSSLPRPSTVSGDAAVAEKDANAGPAARTHDSRVPATLHHRQHHVTKDYTYIHRDLLTILGIGLVVIAFIVGMSFVVA